MPTTGPDWSSNRRLDILVLGPMGDEGMESSVLRLRDALKAILLEPAMRSFLAASSVSTIEVHVPVGQHETDIIHNVLSLLDTADLVVFDLTPKTSNPDRANVFYELALVHALGIPSLLFVKDGGPPVPFYARTSTQYRVSDFKIPTLMNALRAPLSEFLDLENRRTNFTSDRVSLFYGAPIVDISAAVGLATGYYFNFLCRLLMEGSFLSQHPDLIKHVVYVRPSSLNSTYEADIAALKALLAEDSFKLKPERLPALPADDKGPLWFDHVDGIVVDIPRTIYPLRRSPRLLSLLSRHPSFPSENAKHAFDQRLFEMEDALLRRFESAIDFQLRFDGPRVRRRILHFTNIAGAPDLVRRLST